MKIIVFVLALVVGAQCYGQPEVLPALVCSGVSTSTTPVEASSQTLSAYVNALKVVVTPAATTCTVSVASGMLAMYSATEVTGTVIIHPVVEGTTNAVSAGAFYKAFLASDKITVSAHTATTDTNVTVTVTPVIERQP
jgi:hypothetical protein